MARGLGPAVVLLAAGASRRLGEPKALVRLREVPPRSPLEFLLGATQDLDARPLVVTGADHPSIRSYLEAEGWTAGVEPELLENPHWERGRTGSVLAAREARAGRDLLLAPVDVPLVPSAVFRQLAALWNRMGAPPTGWLAPRYRNPSTRTESEHGRHGHPVIVGRGLLDLLAPEDADRPLRELRERADPLHDLPVETATILDDLDTPEDLQGLRERLAESSRN